MGRGVVFQFASWVSALVLMSSLTQCYLGEDDAFFSLPDRYPSANFSRIPVGVLIDANNHEDERIFRSAIDRINDDHSILPRSRFEAIIKHVPTSNTVEAGNQVCKMLSLGVVAIFGPRSDESASHVQSICDSFEIPHIETKWDFYVRKENYLINLAPHPLSLSRAYNDLVEALGWESYVIIYEDEEGLFKLQDLLKATAPPRRRALVRQLSPSGDYRLLFREILRETTLHNLIIDCNPDKIYAVLKQAQQVGLMTYKFSFVLTSLDIQTVDLEDFQFAEANITAFRMVDPEKMEVQQVLKKYSRGSSVRGTQHLEPKLSLRFDTAMIYDALYLLAKALHVLDSSQRMDVKRLDCEGTETWPHGYSIINYMKMVHVQGLTGLIQFNTTGFRTDVQLDVVQLKPREGLRKIGTWDSKFVTKFNWTRPNIIIQRPEIDIADIRNRTFRVTTIINNPFTMLARSEHPLTGNARYEGFVIDLLKKLSEILGFKYEVHPVGDGGYGQKINKLTGQWNGMIREVLEGAADIAVADLTINKERQEAVDFTMPFMNLGISILYVKPSVKPPSLFSFLSPFSRDVWIYMCFAFMGVSVIMYILARLTPYEWDVPHPCVTDPEELVNQFPVMNSFWFMIGSLMQQGSDIAPKITPYEWMIVCPKRKGPTTDVSKGSKVYMNNISLASALWICLAPVFRQKVGIAPRAVSTRMIAGIWWFFTLIMVSSYTANLATFLIVQDLDETIKNVNDLANQDTVKYGCVSTGATAGFFKESELTTNQKIWQSIAKNNKKYKVLVKDNKEGIEKVKSSKGKYAFFMESTVIEYVIERECDLAQVGGKLDSKGYGIALPKGSKYLQSFSSGILRLQEAGVLDDLKRKWWKEERKENVCPTTSDGAEVQPLKLPNVGGVFVVLVGGCMFAIALAILEFIWYSRRLAKVHGVSFCEEFTTGMKFALSCRGNTKPVNGKVTFPPADINSTPKVPSRAASNPYLDLPLSSTDAYGFPKATICPVNGQITRDEFM